ERRADAAYHGCAGLQYFKQTSETMRPDQNPSADANIALIYVGLDDRDQAIIWLNRAYEARFNPSILLRPAFDPLRSDAQFKDLRRRIGLPLRLTSLSDGAPMVTHLAPWVGQDREPTQPRQSMYVG